MVFRINTIVTISIYPVFLPTLLMRCLSPKMTQKIPHVCHEGELFCQETYGGSGKVYSGLTNYRPPLLRGFPRLHAGNARVQVNEYVLPAFQGYP